MWVKTENSDSNIPASFERIGNNVIIRRRFQLVAATDERPAHYEYEEAQMTAEMYEVYQNFEAQINEQADALIELAELIAG